MKIMRDSRKTHLKLLASVVALSLVLVGRAEIALPTVTVSGNQIGHQFSPGFNPGVGISFPPSASDVLAGDGGEAVTGLKANLLTDSTISIIIKAPEGKRIVVRPPSGGVQLFNSLSFNSAGCSWNNFVPASPSIVFEDLKGMAPPTVGDAGLSVANTGCYFDFEMMSSTITSEISFKSVKFSIEYSPVSSGGLIEFASFGGAVTFLWRGSANSTDPGRFVFVESDTTGDHDAIIAVLSGVSDAVSTRASQSSVDELSGEVAKLSTANLDSPVSTRASQESVNQVSSQLGSLTTALNSSHSALDVPVSTRASQASLDALALKIDADTQNDTDLILRSQIEVALASPQMGAVSLFYLPQSQGGLLEFVRQVVSDTIQANKRVGIDVRNAETKLAAGNAALLRQQFKQAYADYREAYRHASK